MDKEREALETCKGLVPFRGALVHLVRTGSHAYGTNTPESDSDYRGVFLPAAEDLLGLHHCRHVERKDPDIVLKGLDDFVRLALNANPNILEQLFIDDENLYYVDTYFMLFREKRRLFLSQLARRTYSGYAWGQLQKMQAGHTRDLGAKRKELIEKIGYDCYDDQSTEFLTEHGWKRFDEISEEMLATINISSGGLEWQSPEERIDQRYSGTMYEVRARGTRAIVTPNHKLLISPCHRNPHTKFSAEYCGALCRWHLSSIEDLLAGRRSHFHVRCAPTERKNDYPVPDEYLVLAGLYLSEGCAAFRVHKNGRKFRSIRFTQKKPGDFHQTADKVAAHFGMTKHVYAKETVWILHGKTAKQIFDDFGHKDLKRLPKWCLHLSSRQTDLLWNAMMLGDGYKRSNRHDVYYTSVKSLADTLQAAMVSSGIPITVLGPYHSVTAYGPLAMYQVYRSRINGAFRAMDLHQVGKIDEPTGQNLKTFEVKDRRIVCFRTPNGTLVTRNQGNIAIHGNSKALSHIFRLIYQGRHLLETGELQVRLGPAEVAHLKAIRAGQMFKTLAEARYAAEGKIRKIESVKSPLPAEPDRAAIEHFLVETQRAWVTDTRPLHGMSG